MRLYDHAPDTWEIVHITEIAEINPTRPDDPPDDDELASFVPMKNIEELTGRLDPSEHRKWGEIKSGYTRFQEGDVVVAKITPSMENGKAALAKNLKNGAAAGTTELHVIRPSEKILPKFILYFVLQEGFRREAEANMTGTAGQMRVPTDFIKDIEIPLPLLVEQKRILAKIQRIFSKIDSSVDDLEEAEVTLKWFRRSLLENALQGRKLQNNDDDSGNSTSKSYSDLSSNKEDAVFPKFSDRPSVPNRWHWSSLEELFSFRNGDELSSDSRNPGEHPVYGGNGKTGTHDEWNIESRALVFGRVGANCGNVHIAPSKSWVTDNAIYTEEIHVDVSLNFLEIMLSHYPLNSLSGGTGQAYISQKVLKKVDVPLPPFSEQKEIANRLDSQLSLISNVKKIIGTEIQRGNRLRQSILKHAYNGKLVSQDSKRDHLEHLVSEGENSDHQEQKTISEVISDVK